MKEKKHSFFIIRRGDRRLSEKITEEAKKGNIFKNITPFGVITFEKGTPSELKYIVEDPDAPKNLKLYDKSKYEEIFRSRSYVVFRSAAAQKKTVYEEKLDFEAWEYELETSWLSEKAAKGIFLESVSNGLYKFSDGEAGEWTYRIDFHIIKGAPEKYLEEFQKDGWEYVCSYKNDHYFRKKGGEHKKERITPELKKLKDELKLKWAFFISFLIITAVGALLIALAALAPDDEIAKKVILYIFGIVLAVSGAAVNIKFLTMLHKLNKEKRLLKYRGE